MNLYHEKFDSDKNENLETDTHVFFHTGPFSQWYPSVFTDHGEKVFAWDDGRVRTFNCAEQFMMFHKAKFFGDDETAEKIMLSQSPEEQKQLGRDVQGFNLERWNKVARIIVTRGNMYKFEQNEDMKAEILRTNDKILVEAAKKDPVWGIGLPVTDGRIFDERAWNGTNWLGDSLMDVRYELQEHKRGNNPELEIGGELIAQKAFLLGACR